MWPACCAAVFLQNSLDDLELIKLVDLGGGLAGVLGSTRELEGLGTVEGGVLPDLGGLL